MNAWASSARCRRSGWRWTRCESPSKKTLRATEQDRPDVAERRAYWRACQVGLDPRRLVFVDETWANTKMTRLCGRALRGHRVVAAVPHDHWKTTTLIAALDHAGVRCSMTLDGAVNRLAFEAFVEQVLTPTLRSGDLVVMDNLSSHKGIRTPALIHAAQAELVYLPSYSPDLNPIELTQVPELWSKIGPGGSARAVLGQKS